MIFQVLTKMMDYTIDETEALRSANEQKTSEIQRIDNQLNKALEVNPNVRRKITVFSSVYIIFIDC